MNVNQFREILNNRSEPLLIILERDYFGSCFLMRPVVKDLKYAYENKLKFHTINEALSSSLIESLGIKQYPTFLFFQNQQLCIKKEGCLNRWQLFNTAKQFYQHTKSLKNSTI